MGATPASLATSLRVMAPLPRLEHFVVSFSFMVCSRWRRYQKNRALFIRFIVNVSARQRTSIRAAQAARQNKPPQVQKSRMRPMAAYAIKLMAGRLQDTGRSRSEEHTSELQSLMRNSYAVFCLKKKKNKSNTHTTKVDIKI